MSPGIKVTMGSVALERTSGAPTGREGSQPWTALLCPTGTGDGTGSLRARPWSWVPQPTSPPYPTPPTSSPPRPGPLLGEAQGQAHRGQRAGSDPCRADVRPWFCASAPGSPSEIGPVSISCLFKPKVSPAPCSAIESLHEGSEG